MPLYEYRCNQCEETFEMMLRFSEADRIPVCPHCKSPNTQRKLSMIASTRSGSSDSFVSSSSSSCGSSGGFS
jgi:putative FmdB family regulatory protein